MSDSEADHRRRLAITAWRLVSGFGILGGAVAGGLYLGWHLGEVVAPKEHLEWASRGIGVAAALAAVKEAIALFPELGKYYRTGISDGFYKLAALLAATAAGLAVSVIPPVGGDWLPETEIQTAPASHVIFLSRQGKATFVVPFFEEAELCALEGSCRTGIEIDQSTLRFINQLIDGLSDCGSEGRPVALQVTGFASSSLFPGQPDSNALNVKTANMRAGAVKDAIETRLEENRQNVMLSVSVREWADYDSMKEAAGFSDRDSRGEYKERRGLFTRRAELKLVDAGGCELAAASSQP